MVKENNYSSYREKRIRKLRLENKDNISKPTFKKKVEENINVLKSKEVLNKAKKGYSKAKKGYSKVKKGYDKFRKDPSVANFFSDISKSTKSLGLGIKKETCDKKDFEKRYKKYRNRR